MRIVPARWWFAAAALLALAPGVRFWQHYHPRPPLHAGDSMRPIRLSSLNGSPFTLVASGRPTIINIFATWCEPCRGEAQDVADAARLLAKRGVDVIGIDQQESGAQVTRFIDEFALPYPIYIDTTGVTHRIFGARFIPTTISIDAAGRIEAIHPGPLTRSELMSIAKMTGGAG